MWYWPEKARSAKYLPTFWVHDTESSHGRYANHAKLITGIDLVKFHGHACDGLFRGIYAMSQALKILFEDGIIDRTDLRFISRNSPCLGDVGAYLTGGRVRFGTQDVLSRPGVWYIIQRISSGVTVEVIEEEGFFPSEIVDKEAQLSNMTDGDEKAQLVTKLKSIQDQWVANSLLTSHPEDHYFAKKVFFNFGEVPYANQGSRTDIIYKEIPE